MKDYYKTLGVEKTAPADEIKKAYRKLALQYHPDRNKGDKRAEEKFKEISEAYAVLSDPDKKRQFDTFGADGFNQRYSTEDIFRGADFGSIFNDMGFSQDQGGGFDNIFSAIFGGGFSGQRAGGFGGRPSKGQDIEVNLQIGFMEAYTGTKRPVSFSLSDGSSRSLTLTIPKGIASGTKMRLAGKGAASPAGGPAGDLYVIIQVASDPRFRREGLDIYGSVKLRLSEALLGCSKAVETPQGPKTLKIPAGVSVGTKLRMKNLGFTSASGGVGHFYVEPQVEIPKELTPEQEKLAQDLSSSGL